MRICLFVVMGFAIGYGMQLLMPQDWWGFPVGLALTFAVLWVLVRMLRPWLS